MYFKEVETIPQNKSRREDEVSDLLDRFVNSGIKKAKIILDESETMPPINVFRRFSRSLTHKYPVSIQERDDGIYLIRL